ncbi:MAG: hypothetical protein C0594_10485 [Marinilabiliales bacterium]|nr:MAG: hypothetical protein C0594_10485 [Marinilabiliales bacterium]
MRFNTKIVFSFIIVLIMSKSVIAQDIHFSQFFNSPLTLNPSTTGDYDGNWRLINNYRRQWDFIKVPYETVGVGFDAPLSYRNNNLGAGLQFISDHSGDSRLSVTKVHASFAYHKKWNNQYIHAGLQAGIVSKSYNIDALTFPNQYNYETGFFDNQLNNGETGLGDKTSYFDLNFGLGWQADFNSLKPFAGLAFFHINKPQESFGFDNVLPVRSVVNVGVDYDFNGKIHFIPGILYMSHSGASDLLIGVRAKSLVPVDLIDYVYLGPYFRGDFINNRDAAVIVAGFEIKNFQVCISYDVNISSLKQATNYRGAFEFSIIYTQESTKVYKTSIPCERY